MKDRPTGSENIVRVSDAAALAALHAQCFDRPWSSAAFENLLAGAAVAFGTADGFILLQAVPPEAEVLTLAVAPAARRHGLARRLLALAAAQLKVERMFLEVAADNAAARALYAACGYAETGRRPAYYKSSGGAVDAVLMQRDFPA